MSLRLLTVLVVGATSILPASAQNYERLSCHELWYARNEIYKDQGYCFKTARAIREFGNAGCQYDSESRVPLTRAERQRVERISRIESELGCNE